jgi:uncharacterized protein
MMTQKMDRSQIEELLHSEKVGRIGCIDGARPYVVPIPYAFDDGFVYAHSVIGSKIRLMRSNPHVCFEIDHEDDLAHWQSVIAWGDYEELTGAAAAEAMRLIVSRLTPAFLTAGLDSNPAAGIGFERAFAVPHSESARGTHSLVYRIRLTEMTGRIEDSRLPSRSAS